MIVDNGAVSGVALIALAMVLTPGPNMIYLSSRSMSQGRRAGLIALAGVAVGFGGHLVAAAAGLAAVLLAVPVLFAVLKMLGAAYLLYVAWHMLRAESPSIEVRSVGPVRARRLFVMGLLTNLLNPKIALMYLALIPQFIEPDRGAVWAQALILGGIQITVALTVNLLVVCGSAAMAGFVVKRPIWTLARRWVTSVVLGGFAVRLATSRAPG